MRYKQRREQLQPWKLGRVSGDGSGCLATAFASSVSSAVSVAAAIADTTTVAGAAASATPTIHVPVGPAVVQRQLPSADQCFGVPIWLVVEHAPLRRQRFVRRRNVRG